LDADQDFHLHLMELSLLTNCLDQECSKSFRENIFGRAWRRFTLHWLSLRY